MIDGVDVTSTFRLGPIHDAQAYICCVSLVRQRLHLDDNAARVIGEDIWQRAQALLEDGHRTAWASSSTTTGSRGASTTRTPPTAHSERGPAWRWYFVPSLRRAAPVAPMPPAPPEMCTPAPPEMCTPPYSPMPASPLPSPPAD